MGFFVPEGPVHFQIFVLRRFLRIVECSSEDKLLFCLVNDCIAPMGLRF